ncbi:ATP phosphoribosyltransferase [bacterium]|nr:ATP phosphoribosyltransferase [bacterium]
MKLKVGLPSGSLQETTLDMFKRAGYKISVGSRSYFPSVDDEEMEVVMFRAQEISLYVEQGVLDAGITGKDWIEENGSKVVEVAELRYAKRGPGVVKWVLAVPKNSKIRTVQQLAGKRIATEVVGLTKRFLRQHKVKAEVEFSWGATEVKAPHCVDAIVDLTETGSSLKVNNLREVATIMESTNRLIANREAWKNRWKRTKIENLSVLLQGALNAATKVGLKMNVPQAKLETILKTLPALRDPTISHLAKEGWVAVETVVDEHVVRQIVPALKKAGAEGIVEYPLSKVIY